jgi:3-oxoacyl-[acyl-carrier-protein] synthase II
MPSHQDSAGRPIVVVTGMGVVTSLGAGKADTWQNLTAGKSGIKNITRFATEGLKTRFAGTVDFVPGRAAVGAGIVRAAGRLAAEEAVAESGIGSRGDFPGRCSSRCRRSRSNGSSAARSRRRPAPTPMSATTI